MILLYDLPISSYGCKTRILLRHKNLQWQSVAPPDGYGSPAYCQIIPAGTIPALDDDGFKLCDSEAIAEYINEIAPTPAMLPVGAKDRATARSLSRFHDSRIEPVLRAYFGQVAPANRDAGFIQDNANLLQTRFDQLAKMVTPAPFLCGNTLGLADCGFVPSFAVFPTAAQVGDSIDPAHFQPGELGHREAGRHGDIESAVAVEDSAVAAVELDAFFVCDEHGHAGAVFAVEKDLLCDIVVGIEINFRPAVKCGLARGDIIIVDSGRVGEGSERKVEVFVVFLGREA